MCYKVKYPENFFLLRGNHECASITRIYGRPFLNPKLNVSKVGLFGRMDVGVGQLLIRHRWKWNHVFFQQS